MWSQGFCGFVAHVKVNQIHSLLEAIFAFWRSYKLKLTQVEGCSPMQAWDIPESTGCTELESDAESSIQYQDLTSIWLSATSIYLFFSPFFSNKKTQQAKLLGYKVLGIFLCATSPKPYIQPATDNRKSSHWHAELLSHRAWCGAGLWSYCQCVCTLGFFVVPLVSSLHHSSMFLMWGPHQYRPILMQHLWGSGWRILGLQILFPLWQFWAQSCKTEMFFFQCNARLYQPFSLLSNVPFEIHHWNPNFFQTPPVRDKCISTASRRRTMPWSTLVLIVLTSQPLQLLLPGITRNLGYVASTRQAGEVV